MSVFPQVLLSFSSFSAMRAMRAYPPGLSMSVAMVMGLIPVSKMSLTLKMVHPPL